MTWVKDVLSHFLRLYILRVTPLGLLTNVRWLLPGGYFCRADQNISCIALTEINILSFEGNTCLGRVGAARRRSRAVVELPACWCYRGVRGPEYHHTTTSSCYSSCLHVHTFCQEWIDKATVFVQHDQQSGHFMLCRCGQRLLGVKSNSLHFKLSYLKLCSVLDAYHIFTAVWVVSHFSGDTLK